MSTFFLGPLPWNCPQCLPYFQINAFFIWFNLEFGNELLILGVQKMVNSYAGFSRLGFHFISKLCPYFIFLTFYWFVVESLLWQMPDICLTVTQIHSFKFSFRFSPRNKIPKTNIIPNFYLTVSRAHFNSKQVVK